MTCFKPTLALSAISLLLAGCGGSDSKPTTPNTDTAQIKLVVQSIEDMQYQTNTGEHVARQVDAKGYQHLMITEGYEIAVDEGDDGGDSYVLRNQSFEYGNDNVITLSVTGKATVTVSYPHLLGTKYAYTVASVEKSQCSANDTLPCHSQYAVPVMAGPVPTPVYLANTQWNYVTVPDSPIYYDAGDLIAIPQLGYSDMTKSTDPINGQHYWFGYASAETEMQIITTEGLYTVPINLDEQRNHHQAVTMTTTDEGDIVFNAPPVEGMGPIAPILPELLYELASPGKNSEYDCRQENGVLYSFKAYSKKWKACLIPSLSKEAKTRQYWEYYVNAPFSPMPAEPTTYYSKISSPTESKQLCHNYIALRSYPEQYQNAVYSYINPYSYRGFCFAEVMNIGLYPEDETDFFSLEMLNRELKGLQFFDVQHKVSYDSLNHIDCSSFNEQQINNCQMTGSHDSVLNRMTFNVVSNDITLPLKAFAGTESLSQFNHYGLVDKNSLNSDTSGTFYQFAIMSPDKITKHYIKIFPSSSLFTHRAYVYDSNFELQESYTTEHAMANFYRDYHDYTLVRNADNPKHSLILRLENMQGTELEFRGLDFTFHDSLQ